MSRHLFELETVLEAVDLQLDATGLRHLRLALSVDLTSRRDPRVPLKEVLSGVSSAVRQRQIVQLFDSMLRFEGQLAWSRLEGAASIANMPDELFALTDFEARADCARSVVSAAACLARAAFSQALYERRRRGAPVAKMIGAGDLARLKRKAEAACPPSSLTTRLDLLADRKIDFANAVVLGQILVLQAACAGRGPSIHAALQRARRLRLCERYRIACSPTGAPLAVVGWAWLDERAMVRLARSGIESLHWSELGEGTRPCFVDAVGDPRAVGRLQSELANAFVAVGHPHPQELSPDGRWRAAGEASHRALEGVAA